MIQTLYNLDEITLIPAKTSRINSRSECDPYQVIENSITPTLPLFASPMSCVTNLNNYQLIYDEGINVIIPRTVPWENRLDLLAKEYWVAMGFKEIKYMYNQWSKQLPNYRPHVCIDQATGHMESLLQLCADLKHLFDKDGICIMTGNIATPETYYEYAIHGIDYVRVAVGTGHGCTTSCKTGFNYPMGSLLIDINEVRKSVRRDLLSGVLCDNCIYTEPRVVADGGFSSNDQIIKALALGADFVMLGEIIAKSWDSSWNITALKNNVTYIDSPNYYGMSTEKAQQEIWEAMCPEVRGELTIKESEGIEKDIKVHYTLDWWVGKFISHLKSAMSYANATNLNEFIGKVRWAIISHDSYMKFMGKVIK